MGQKANFIRKITLDDVVNFQNLTGDENPLHTNELYAKQTKFKKPIVYGLLIQSFFSRLAGVHLPGKYCLILSINTQFRKPCFVGDVLTISGEITSKSDSTKIITLKTEIINTNKEVIAGGGITIQLLK